jgi:hypothetical protein
VTVQVVQVTIPSSEIRKIAEEAVSKVAVAAASDAMKALPLDPPVHEPSIQDHPESATASSSEDVEELPESSFDEVGEDSEDETDDDLFEDVGIGDDEDSEDSDLG